jgi:hypothetical protein
MWESELMQAVLQLVDPAQRQRRIYAAQLLLDAMGLGIPLQCAAATDPQSAGLHFGDDVTVADTELEDIFASVTLQREMVVGRYDCMGMFDEQAVSWDVWRPWIDLRAKELRALVNRRDSLKIRPNQQFRVIISHDMDHTSLLEPTTLIRSCLHMFGLFPDAIPIEAAVSSRTWLKNYERLLDYERKHGIGAYYFMLSGPYGMRRYSSRSDIRWSSSRKLLQLIVQAGMTVGLHGSYYAREQGSYRAERERLEQVLGTAVTTHRNHYLRFDPVRMWSDLEAAGICYDFSVGFNWRLGFRAGCAKAYRGFNFLRDQAPNVIAIPLLFMDGILLCGNRQQTLHRLRMALEEAKRVDGCISLLFHPELFLADPTYFRIFEDILAACQELGADMSGRLPEWSEVFQTRPSS